MLLWTLKNFKKNTFKKIVFIPKFISNVVLRKSKENFLKFEEDCLKNEGEDRFFVIF